MTFVYEKERISALSPDGRTAGFIAFPRIRSGLVNISQVMVFPAFRGQSVDRAMMEALLPHLEQHDLKAALTSPFAQNYVAKNPKWQHILPGKLHMTSH